MRLTRLLLCASLFFTLSGFDDTPDPEPEPDAGTPPVDGGTTPSDDGGSPPSEVYVTLTSPGTGDLVYGGLVTGHVDDDGSVAVVEVTVTDTDGDSVTETVEIDAYGDFAHGVKIKGTVPGDVTMLSSNLTVTVVAKDEGGLVLASDSVGGVSITPCSGGQTPSRSGQSVPTWEGDYRVCGYNYSAYTLKYDANNNVVPFTDIVSSETCGWFGWNCSSNDDGSFIVNGGRVADGSGSLLSELQSVEKDFVIQASNAGGNSLAGMYAGMQVGGKFVVHNVAYMSDITPIQYLDVTSSTPSLIQISHLPQVSQCDAEAIIDELRARGWNGTAVVNGNGPCN